MNGILIIAIIILIIWSPACHGTFFDNWKLSQIVTILKSAGKQDIRNYRPVSKKPCIPKLFESIITNQISPHINKWLSESQYNMDFVLVDPLLPI